MSTIETISNSPQINILYVCTGNTCRSPMAQYLSDVIFKNAQIRANIVSAGLAAQAGQAASKNAITALLEYEADLSKHKSRGVDSDLLSKSDLVLCMTSEHKGYLERIYPEYRDKYYTVHECAGEKGAVPDPYGGDLPIYVSTARVLHGLIQKIVQSDYVKSILTTNEVKENGAK